MMIFIKVTKQQVFRSVGFVPSLLPVHEEEGPGFLVPTYSFTHLCTLFPSRLLGRNGGSEQLCGLWIAMSHPQFSLLTNAYLSFPI